MGRTSELKRLYQAGHEAYPRLHVDEAAFQKRLDAVTTGQLGALHGADLYLACGCLEQDPASLAVLEKKLAAAVPLASHVDPSSDFRDEVHQRLRVMLLMPRSRKSAKLREYNGRGPLSAWLRTVVHGTAVSLLRETHRAPRPGAPSPVVKLLATDPEILLFRAQHGAELRYAFGKALEILPASERELVRRYYLEGAQPEDLAQAAGVHRTTISRRLAQAQHELLQETRRILAERTGQSIEELQSSFRAVLDHLDLSLPIILSPR